MIDLSTCQTINDVVNAINSASGIQVTAAVKSDPVHGDYLLLTDNTGDSGNKGAALQVQNVGNGTTATALGLAGVGSSGNTLTGKT